MLGELLLPNDTKRGSRGVPRDSQKIRDRESSAVVLTPARISPVVMATVV